MSALRPDTEDMAKKALVITNDFIEIINAHNTDDAAPILATTALIAMLIHRHSEEDPPRARSRKKDLFFRAAITLVEWHVAMLAGDTKHQEDSMVRYVAINGEIQKLKRRGA